MPKPRVGREWPVWWDTEDGRPAGSHKARILEVRAYTGCFIDAFTHTLRLTAPRTRRGWTEMAVHEKYSR
jgi:hypothetical protein